LCHFVRSDLSHLINKSFISLPLLSYFAPKNPSWLLPPE
jgi:hypothetical protein